MKRQKLKAEQINHADRVGAALAMRKEGKTFEEIARELGWNSMQAAHKAVKEAVNRLVREPADELREINTRRLESSIAAIWPKVEKGELKAIDTLVKLVDRLSKLHGLDAPNKTGLTDTDGKDIRVTKDEAAQKIAQILELAAARRAEQGQSSVFADEQETVEEGKSSADEEQIDVHTQ